MQQYLRLCSKILEDGTQQMNRTGIPSIFIPGAMMEFDLAEGFPAVTTKKFFFNQMKGELCGFLEGATSAARFRELGCTFWDQNANENAAWLANPNRKGEDDLGHIYGDMWRNWSKHPGGFIAQLKNLFYKVCHSPKYKAPFVDQLQNIINKIRTDPTDRRMIMSAWRPDMFDQMALPPCHVLYQFIANVQTKELHLCMYQRSCDMFLGVPHNIASASLLLSIVAKITGYTPRKFTHFLADAHIYVNHIDQVLLQMTRDPMTLCKLVLSDSLTDINNVQPDMIKFEDYYSHEAITGEMAV